MNILHQSTMLTAPTMPGFVLGIGLPYDHNFCSTHVIHLPLDLFLASEQVTVHISLCKLPTDC